MSKLKTNQSLQYKMMFKSKNPNRVCGCFHPPGHRGREPGGDGGGDPAEKAQTQATSGQRLVGPGRRRQQQQQQGQEAAWTPAGGETVPQPAQTHQADEHHHRHGDQLQRRVRRRRRRRVTTEVQCVVVALTHTVLLS